MDLSQIHDWVVGAELWCASAVRGNYTIPLAYVISIFVGGFAARFWVDYLRKGVDPGFVSKKERLRRLDWSLGFIERAITTTLIIWAPKLAPAFIGGWIALKFAANWQQRKEGDELKLARRRLSSLIGSAISFVIAIGCGIWANPKILSTLSDLAP